MNPGKKKPTLRDILISVKNNKDFESKCISIKRSKRIFFLKI